MAFGKKKKQAQQPQYQQPQYAPVEKPKKPFYKRVWFIVVVIIVVLIIIGAAASSGGSKTETTPPSAPPTTGQTGGSPTTPGDSTPTKAPETQATFEQTAAETESGMVSITFKITGDYDYFNSSDAKNQALAESVYDKGLAYAEENYPKDTNLWFTVYTQDNSQKSGMAFSIERPNPTATPRVQFQKWSKANNGSMFDYYWWDNRYGNGRTWE